MSSKNDLMCDQASQRPRGTLVRPRASAFLADARGSVAIVFALSVIVVFAMVGGAIDFGRLYHAKSQAQNAMDAAVLAAGRVLQTTNDESEAIAAGATYFDKLKTALDLEASPAFSFHEAGTVVRGEFDADMVAPFLSIAGIATLPVHARAEAVLASGGNAGTNVEVSLMLDVTGSMSGQKIVDMKEAAKDLIDIVVWDDQSAHTSRIALVPFAPRVNIGSYISDVTNLPAEKTFGGSTKRPRSCVTERTGPEEFTDAAPVDANSWISAYKGDHGAPAIANSGNYNNSGSCGNPSASEQVMPLTADKVALKGRIDALSDGGSTAGALGTAWAWYTLSPNWSGIWSSTSTPAPYSELSQMGEHGQPRLQKIAILMSDGVYNTYGGEHLSGSSNATWISEKAVQLCTNMKAAGIKVYTVGFALGSSGLAVDTLRDCASREANDPAEAPSYFYNASTGDELRQAFREIALQIATLRIKS